MPGDKEAENKETASKKRLSRRDFLVAGGTVAAVDALIAATPAKAAAPRRLQLRKPAIPHPRAIWSTTARNAPAARRACSAAHSFTTESRICRVRASRSFRTLSANSRMIFRWHRAGSVKPRSVWRTAPWAPLTWTRKTGMSEESTVKNALVARTALKCAHSSRTGRSGSLSTGRGNRLNAISASIPPTGMKKGAPGGNRPAWKHAR